MVIVVDLTRSSESEWDYRVTGYDQSFYLRKIYLHNSETKRVSANGRQSRRVNFVNAIFLQVLKSSALKG